MSDDTNPSANTDANGSAAETGSPIDGETDSGTTETHEQPSNREARYRRQLRETEAERDRLAARVESMHRAEIHRIAAGRLADPSDFKNEIADMLDDDGNVSQDKVNTALDALLTSKPHYARPTPPQVPFTSQVTSTGVARSEQPMGDPWRDAFKSSKVKAAEKSSASSQPGVRG